MSTLRKFINTKIFPTKISYNKNFPIYGTIFLSDNSHEQTYQPLSCTTVIVCDEKSGREAALQPHIQHALAYTHFKSCINASLHINKPRMPQKFS